MCALRGLQRTGKARLKRMKKTKKPKCNAHFGALHWSRHEGCVDGGTTNKAEDATAPIFIELYNRQKLTS